jgi:hypothetical protein
VLALNNLASSLARSPVARTADREKLAADGGVRAARLDVDRFGC